MSTIRVMLSAAFKEAYLALVPQFERATGHQVESLWVTSAQIMSRLKGGEAVDIVILSSEALDELVRLGLVAPSGKFDLASCGIAMAVKSGAPRPAIGDGEALRRAVLAARSLVYSLGPSGIHLKGLFERWGIAGEIASKVRIVQGEPAGAPVARGEAELGFQQMSELLPVPGIDIVGPLPPDIQKITVFSAGVHVRAGDAAAARALIAHFGSPAARPVIRSKGMEPAAAA